MTGEPILDTIVAALGVLIPTGVIVGWQENVHGPERVLKKYAKSVFPMR